MPIGDRPLVPWTVDQFCAKVQRPSSTGVSRRVIRRARNGRQAGADRSSTVGGDSSVAVIYGTPVSSLYLGTMNNNNNPNPNVTYLTPVSSLYLGTMNNNNNDATKKYNFSKRKKTKARFGRTQKGDNAKTLRPFPYATATATPNAADAPISVGDLSREQLLRKARSLAYAHDEDQKTICELKSMLHDLKGDMKSMML